MSGKLTYFIHRFERYWFTI